MVVYVVSGLGGVELLLWVLFGVRYVLVDYGGEVFVVV